MLVLVVIHQIKTKNVLLNQHSSEVLDNIIVDLGFLGHKDDVDDAV